MEFLAFRTRIEDVRLEATEVKKLVVCGALEDVIHHFRQSFDFQQLTKPLALVGQVPHTLGQPLAVERVEVAVAGVPLELGHIENEVTKFLRVGARNEAFPHGVALRVKIVFDLGGYGSHHSAGLSNCRYSIGCFVWMPGVISGSP